MHFRNKSFFFHGTIGQNVPSPTIVYMLIKCFCTNISYPLMSVPLCLGRDD